MGHKIADETDIVAIDSIGKNIVLGECKYFTSEKGLSILHVLQERTKSLQALTGAENVEYIIFNTAKVQQQILRDVVLQ